MNKVKAYFDGACPDNPGGDMGWGFFVETPNGVIHSDHGHVPPADNNSNNSAEHLALTKLLEWLENANPKPSHIDIYGDSMMIIKQVKGRYKMNPKKLYYDYGVDCLSAFKRARKDIKITFHWIPREENERVDNLSKMYQKL